MAAPSAGDSSKAGCLVFLLVGAVFFFWCVAHMPSQEERRASARSSATDRADRIAKMRATFCTPEMDKLAAKVVTKIDGSHVYVKAMAWASAEYDGRVGLAVWFSVCRHNGDMVWVNHGNTGKTLATYDADWGYSSKE